MLLDFRNYEQIIMTLEQEKKLEEIFGKRTPPDEYDYDPTKPRKKPTPEQVNGLIELIRRS
jgi:hypothetical protein